MEKSLSGRGGRNEVHDIMSDHNLFIVWEPRFNLGIPIIDEQHRGIVTTINSLYFGIRNHFVHNTFAAIVQMMNEYTRIHFEVEETFLEKIDYSNAQKHRALHAELMEQLMYTGRQSLLNGDPNQFLEFLKGWWISHICCEDLLYRDSFIS